ncbi:unnamed protein product, partial [Amoebophrya sp. A25]
SNDGEEGGSKRPDMQTLWNEYLYPGRSMRGILEQDLVKDAIITSESSTTRSSTHARTSFEMHLMQKLLSLDRTGVAAEFWIKRRANWNYLLTVYCARSRGRLWRAARHQEAPEIGPAFQERAFRRREAGSKKMIHAGGGSHNHKGANAGGGGKGSGASSRALSISPTKSFRLRSSDIGSGKTHFRYIYRTSKFRDDIMRDDPTCRNTFHLGCLPPAGDLLHGSLHAKLVSKEKRQAMTVWADDESERLGRDAFLPDLREIERHESR